MLEIFAAITTLVSAYYATKKNILTWTIGILSSVLYGIFFFKLNLYANFILQIVFISLSFWGLIEWKVKGKVKNINKKTWSNDIERISLVISFMILYWILPYFKITQLDAITTIGSLIATYLLIKMRIDNWIWWIITDLIYCDMFAVQKNWISLITYTILTWISAQGLIKWHFDNEKI